MERQTSLFLICVALLVCSATVFGQSVFTARFEERKEGDSYGYARGTVYYKWDGTCASVAAGKPPCLGKTDRGNSRLLFQYEIGTEVINNLYQYGENALFSMCSSSCSGILLTHKADPWYFDSNYYTKDSTKKEGDLYWYNRTSYGTSNTVSMDTELVSPQVTAILMNDKAWGSGLKVKKILFDDHREVTIDTSTIEFKTGLDSLFVVDPKLNCPKATCPIFADLVFVLDNSGSVDSTEWGQTVNFVKKVIDTFTFGEDAANAAVIQFNAPSTYSNGYNTVYYPCPTSSNPTKQCSCSKLARDCTFKTCSNPKSCATYFTGKDTASLIAGKNVFANVSDVSVSPDPVSIKSNLTGKPSCYGNTCQGYGLELAIKVLDNSPRRRYGLRPQPIVIAVTDGVDHCPNKTFNAAEKLRTQYGALVIEVGVGMSTGCGGYDINFLKRVASKIGSEDNPAYYNVTNYNAIKELSDKLFKPICVGMDGACGPDCLGFCACGKCLCPDCVQSNSSCFDVSCRADATSATGCRRNDHPCPKGDLCNQYVCNKDDYNEATRCVHYDYKTICKPEIEANKNFKCREVTCDGIEGCQVTPKDSYCQKLFNPDNNKCLKYVCAANDADADPKLGDGKSGCYLQHNYTKELEVAMEDDTRANCMHAYCDPTRGALAVDDCPSRLGQDGEHYAACHTSACEKTGSNYYCTFTDIAHDPDTKCATLVCDSENGWVYQSRPERNCSQEFIDNHIILPSELPCMRVDCPLRGDVCTYENLTKLGCDAYCPNDAMEGCYDEADKDNKDRDAHECVPWFCDKFFEDGDYKAFCNKGDGVDCFDDKELLKEIADLNGDGRVRQCYFVQCMRGKCNKNFTYMPTDLNDNKCQRYNCSFISPGVYEWKQVPSDEALSCHSNACFERECVPTEGCINKKDICEELSNFCFKLTCVNLTPSWTENLICTNESLLNRTQCVMEVCEDGKPRPVYDIDACNLTETYLCLDRACEYDGNIKDENGNMRVGPSKCVYTDKPEPQDDICAKYVCDNTTGEWNSSEKCVDDDLCTEDICNVFGKCRYPVITCDELSMDAYPCYYKMCIPDIEHGVYMCKRRHIKGAMIDLCGNCIMEKDEAGPGVVSDSMLVDSKYVAPVSASSSSSSISLVSCTMAGPRPLLTEGLAAASIALIIIGAVVIGAGIAASGVLGTRELIRRARGANNQSAHTNPLFQENEAEMSNPAFIEEKDA